MSPSSKKVISDIVWVRTYFKALLRQYPAVIAVNAGDGKATTNVAACKQYLESPLEFFSKTEGPSRDPTWIQSLPNEALRVLMKHALEMSSQTYVPEIRGGATKNWPG